MSVIIKIDTGFVGGIHEEDTGLTVKEWQAQSDKEKNQWLQDATNEVIDTYAVDEDDEDTIL